MDELEDALPRCPKFLVPLEVEGDALVLVWLECTVCGDVFL